MTFWQFWHDNLQHLILIANFQISAIHDLIWYAFKLNNYNDKTSLDFNYVKPCFDLLQFKYNFITLGQKDFLI